jgi:hypothetical protein
VDGRILEAAWEEVEPFGQFIQGEPLEGAVPTAQTEVRVVFDGDAIYVAARMYDPEPDRIGRQMTRRDEGGQYDFFDVSLSPANDRRTAYRFRVSAAGVQSDAYLYDDVREDGSWDAVWESAVHLDDLGWTAEFRIPLSQLRYRPSSEPQRWGVNFSRRRLRSNERSYFALESRTGGGRVSVYGELAGLLLPNRAIPVEFRPYVMARGRLAPSDDANPFFDGTEGRGNAGLDARIGLGGPFALNLTVNPDFGQVEVDPAVINLSAFETFYPERRPFFVEDARLLGFSLAGPENGLFYSRRIGREPQVRSVSGARYTDVPSESTILGAAKVTGRTAGGLSLGTLVAVTDEEWGRADLGEQGIRRFRAEPRSYAAVFSWQQDLRGGASTVTGTATSLIRDLPDDGSMHHLVRGAWSAGFGFEHTWSRRTWALSGRIASSLIEGAPAALLRVQRSPNHYFQRPDAQTNRLDSTATSMTGVDWRLQFDKRGGRHWTWSVWTGGRTPGFEVNDLGWVQGSERLDIGARLGYREITPGPLFQNYRFGLFTFHNFRHEALDRPLDGASWRQAHKAGTVMLNTDFTLRNYWSLGLDLRARPTTLSDGLTRGGPVMKDPGSLGGKLEAASDRRRALSGSADLDLNRGHAGHSVSTGVALEYRPSPGVEFQIRPRLSWQTDRRQYVTAIRDTGYAATYGVRYLFGDLDRQTLSFETRLNMVFSPSLTLQLFAQPLISTGDYLRYKQLAYPRTFSFDVFESGTALVEGSTVRCTGGRICAFSDRQYVDVTGDGRADFNFREQDFRLRSLRGNAVLRWEYRPGSALFLVWQQSRSVRDTDASRFTPLAELGSLLGDPAEHIFSIKLSYWLGL